MDKFRRIDPTWSRRGLLAAGAAASATLLLPGGARARPVGLDNPNRERSLSFVHIHTGERLKTVYWADGEYIEESLYEIDWHLRDFRSGDIFPYDVRLLDLLHRLRTEMKSDAAFQVISGYRSPATNAMLLQKGRGVRKKSLHMKGMAIDIRLTGRDTASLWHAGIQARRGGVGFYPKYDFVHLDLGPFWHWCAPKRCMMALAETG